MSRKRNIKLQPWTTFYTNLLRLTAHQCAMRFHLNNSSRCPLNQSSGKYHIFREFIFCWGARKSFSMAENSYLLWTTKFLLNPIICLDHKVIMLTATQLLKINCPACSSPDPASRPRDSLLKSDPRTTRCLLRSPDPFKWLILPLLRASGKRILTRRK